MAAYTHGEAQYILSCSDNGCMMWLLFEFYLSNDIDNITQTVAGTNYRILCEATTVYPGAEMHYAVVNVYESLEGNANIISVTDGYVS